MKIKPDKKMDPRQRRTRGLIKDAFEQLLVEKAFDSITILDITERATVNRTTFYDHFDDKYALMEFCFEDAFQQMLSRTGLEVCRYNSDSLKHLIMKTCEFLVQYQGQCPGSNHNLMPRFEIKITSHLRRILQHWLSQGPHPETSEMEASVTSWAVYGAAFHWKKIHRQSGLDAYVEQVMPVITKCMTISSVEYAMNGG